MPGQERPKGLQLGTDLFSSDFRRMKGPKEDKFYSPGRSLAEPRVSVIMNQKRPGEEALGHFE